MRCQDGSYFCAGPYEIWHSGFVVVSVPALGPTFAFPPNRELEDQPHVPPDDLSPALQASLSAAA